jgi:hypothetical protein
VFVSVRPVGEGRHDLLGGLSFVFGCEELTEPFVEGLDDGLLAYEDVAGMRVADTGIAGLGGASVVAARDVSGLSVHASSARRAEHAAAE